MIKIENLTLAYALSHIHCHIPKGKLVGIMGANGAGKSSLLKSIAGIIPPQSGQIWLNNAPLNAMNARQKSEQFAYLAQNTAIQWDLSTYEVIALGLPAPLNPKVEQEKVRSVSAQFSITPLLANPFQQLSGGEKARVQLARCVIKNTPLLLADEPIAALDPYYQLDIMEKLQSLTPHTSCVIVIHHLDLAYRFCDEIILLKNGKILAKGVTQAVLTEENIAQAFGVKVNIDRDKKSIFLSALIEH